MIPISKRIDGNSLLKNNSNRTQRMGTLLLLRKRFLKIRRKVKNSVSIALWSSNQLSIPGVTRPIKLRSPGLNRIQPSCQQARESALADMGPRFNKIQVILSCRPRINCSSNSSNCNNSSSSKCSSSKYSSSKYSSSSYSNSIRSSSNKHNHSSSNHSSSNHSSNCRNSKPSSFNSFNPCSNKILSRRFPDRTLIRLRMQIDNRCSLQTLVIRLPIPDLQREVLLLRSPMEELELHRKEPTPVQIRLLYRRPHQSFLSRHQLQRRNNLFNANPQLVD